jgi:Fe-S-cluster containining protein
MRREPGFAFAFACRRSGNCCAIPGGIVRVTAAEAAAIAAYLGLSPEAFASRYLQADGTRLKDGLGNRCVFLTEGAQAGCGIYAVRPQACREWPFWAELRDDPALQRQVLGRCPGITWDGTDTRGD